MTELYCPNCKEVKDYTATSYECGNCGEKFTLLESVESHRCPRCGKFASKVSDNACPDCGVELEEQEEAEEEEG